MDAVELGRKRVRQIGLVDAKGLPLDGPVGRQAPVGWTRADAKGTSKGRFVHTTWIRRIARPICTQSGSLGSGRYGLPQQVPAIRESPEPGSRALTFLLRFVHLLGISHVARQRTRDSNHLNSLCGRRALADDRNGHRVRITESTAKANERLRLGPKGHVSTRRQGIVVRRRDQVRVFGDAVPRFAVFGHRYGLGRR